MSLSQENASEATTPFYKYSVLPSPQSIRLIELKTSAEGIWSDITVSLTVTNIHEAPEFDALSYTWGNPLTPYSEEDDSVWSMDAIRRYPVEIDGCPLMVTANLIDAFRMLDDSYIQRVARRSQYLWVDSVCINQEDPVERAAQVSLMGSIYENAQNVVVWLGQEDAFTKDAFAVIMSLSAIPRQRHSEVKLSDWYDQGRVLRRLGVLEDFTPHMWCGLVAFLNRPWFSRAWVVQEVGLARNAVVVCGRKVLPWAMLSDTITFLTSTGWHDQISTDRMILIDVLVRNPGPYRKLLDAHLNVGMAAIYLESTRTGIVSVGHKALFRYLIQVHRSCNATDPRDMIYAFLGLAWQQRLPFSTNPEAIVPDYQISVQNLYTNVAKTMLESYNDLRFLSHVQDSSGTAIGSLPSWVPDYSVELRPAPLSMRGASSWKASGNLCWNEEPGSQEPGRLSVAGFLLDKVTAAVEDLPNSHDFRETAATDPYWISVFKLTRQLNNTYPTQSSRSRVEMLWRTLLANTYNGQHPAPDSCRIIFWDYCTRAIARIFAFEETENRRLSHDPNEEKRWEVFARIWLSLLENEPEGSPFNCEEFEDRFSAAVDQELSSGQDQNYQGVSNDFERELRYTGNVRRLFRTGKGYLGIGAQTLRTDDEVWILGGADTPMVLRKQSNGFYKLIGEAYVHDVMHGEAVESVTQEQLCRIYLE